MQTREGCTRMPGGPRTLATARFDGGAPAPSYSSTPFTFPSARRRSMIFWAMGGGTVS